MIEADNGHLKISEKDDLYKLEVPPTLIPKDEGVYKLHLENRLGEQDLECNLKLIREYTKTAGRVTTLSLCLSRLPKCS